MAHHSCHIEVIESPILLQEFIDLGFQKSFPIRFTYGKNRDGRNGNGAGTRTRTADLRFTKPLLCQLSYAGSDVERRGRGVNSTGNRRIEANPGGTTSPRKLSLVLFGLSRANQESVRPEPDGIVADIQRMVVRSVRQNIGLGLDFEAGTLDHLYRSRFLDAM